MENKYLLTKDYAKIYINSKKHGLKTMLVSLEDFKTLNDKTKNMTIYLSVYPTNIYAVYEKNNKSISIHRDIMNTPKGLQTDHINGNGLDNRRENLRIVTRVVNNQNRKLSKNNKSLKCERYSMQYDKNLTILTLWLYWIIVGEPEKRDSFARGVDK